MTSDVPAASREGPRVGASSDVGRVRESNEDAFLVLPPLFAVADGMGGAKGGRLAADLALRALADQPPVQHSHVAASFRLANRRVWDASMASPSNRGMGTTLTSVLIDHGAASIGHVGDSRAYLFRNGTLRQLTTDHTRVEEMVRAGIITLEQASDHPERNVLLRAVGTHPEVEVETTSVPLRRGDRILLCTDGVHRSLTAEEIQYALTPEDDPDAICRRLVERANDKGGRDNATAVLVDLAELEVSREPRRRRPSLMAAAAVLAMGAVALSFAALTRPSPDPPVRPSAFASSVESFPFDGIVPRDGSIDSTIQANLDATPPNDLALVWTGPSGAANLDLVLVSPAGYVRVFHAGSDGIGVHQVAPGQGIVSVAAVDLAGDSAQEMAFLVGPQGRKSAMELRIVGVENNLPRMLLDVRIQNVVALTAGDRKVLVERGPCCPSAGLDLVVRIHPRSGELRLSPQRDARGVGRSPRGSATNRERVDTTTATGEDTK